MLLKNLYGIESSVDGVVYLDNELVLYDNIVTYDQLYSKLSFSIGRILDSGNTLWYKPNHDIPVREKLCLGGRILNVRHARNSISQYRELSTSDKVSWVESVHAVVDVTASQVVHWVLRVSDDADTRPVTVRRIRGKHFAVSRECKTRVIDKYAPGRPADCESEATIKVVTEFAKSSGLCRVSASGVLYSLGYSTGTRRYTLRRYDVGVPKQTAVTTYVGAYLQSSNKIVFDFDVSADGKRLAISKMVSNTETSLDVYDIFGDQISLRASYDLWANGVVFSQDSITLFAVLYLLDDERFDTGSRYVLATIDM